MSTAIEKRNDIETLSWFGLYREGWRDQLPAQAFAHPAKYSYGLIIKIVRFGLERAYWRKNDLIGDQFGGVACGGVVAAYNGLRWLGVELEEHFCSLANGFECDDGLWPNEKAKCGAVDLHEPHHVQGVLELHRAKLVALGCPLPRLVRGDSRRFAAIVAESLNGVCTSPPHGSSTPVDGRAITDWQTHTKDVGSMDDLQHGYGTADGQIGSLPAGDVLDAVVSIPPYSDQEIQGGGANAYGAKRQADKIGGPYGDTAGQIGALSAGSLDACLTSPPYAECVQGVHRETETAADSWRSRSDMGQGGSLGQSQRHGGYGETDGQIGAIPEGRLDAAVTSPPWQQNCEGGVRSTIRLERDGQVGVTSGDTYWKSMAIVWRQVWLSLKPSGVLCVVVKSYVRDGAVIDLPGQTMQLLEACGFRVFLLCRAWLTEEQSHPGLFGEAITKKTSRKSFFRRIFEKKYPHNSIDFECVIWARKE